MSLNRPVADIGKHFICVRISGLLNLVLVCQVEDGKVTDTGMGSMQSENIKAASMVFHS